MMSEPDIDKGWAWVILFTAFCGMFFNGIMIYSTGVIMAAMLQEIDNDLTRVSWVASLFGTTMCSSGLLVGFVTNRYGCRVSAFTGGIVSLVGLTGAYFSRNVYHLIPTYSILAGIGVGFILCTAVVISGYHFKKYRALASGVAVSGAGCGMFVGPPVIRLLIDQYTLKGAFLVLGAVISNNCVFGMLMRPSPTELENMRKSSGTSEDNRLERKPSTIKTLLIATKSYFLTFKNIPFLAYVLSTFALAAGESAALLHLPNYAEQQGTSKMAAATLMTATGSTSLISRLLIGFAASDPHIGPEILHIALLGVIGLLTLTFPLYSHSFGTQILYAAGYGMYSGGINTLVNPITAELVNLENLASGFGVLAFTAGLGVIAGTPVAGIIADSSTYAVSYVYAGSLLLIASFVAVPIALKKDKNALTIVKDAKKMDVGAPSELEPLRADDVETIPRDNVTSTQP